MAENMCGYQRSWQHQIVVFADDDALPTLTKEGSSTHANYDLEAVVLSSINYKRQILHDFFM